MMNLRLDTAKVFPPTSSSVNAKKQGKHQASKNFLAKREKRA